MGFWEDMLGKWKLIKDTKSKCEQCDRMYNPKHKDDCEVTCMGFIPQMRKALSDMDKPSGNE